MSLLVFLLLLSSHLALYPQLNILINISELPLEILGPSDVLSILADPIVNTLSITAIQADIHELSLLNTDMVLMSPLVHRVLLFVRGSQKAVPVIHPRLFKLWEILLMVKLLLGEDCGLPILVIEGV